MTSLNSNKSIKENFKSKNNQRRKGETRKKATESQNSNFNRPPSGFTLLKKTSEQREENSRPEPCEYPALNYKSNSASRLKSADSQTSAKRISAAAKSGRSPVHTKRVTINSKFAASFEVTRSGGSTLLRFPERDWHEAAHTNKIYSNLTFPGTFIGISGSSSVGKKLVASLLLQPAFFFDFTSPIIYSESEVVAHVTYDNIVLLVFPNSPKAKCQKLGKLCNITLNVASFKDPGSLAQSNTDLDIVVGAPAFEASAGLVKLPELARPADFESPKEPIMISDLDDCHLKQLDSKFSSTVSIIEQFQSILYRLLSEQSHEKAEQISILEKFESAFEWFV